MFPANKDEKLFSEFSPVSSNEWKQKMESDCKTDEEKKRLIWKTIEGILVNPFYRIEDTEKLNHINDYSAKSLLKGNKTNNNNWLIHQDIYTDNIIEANKLAKDFIKNDVESIGFNCDSVKTVEQLTVLLKGFDIEKTALNFNSSLLVPSIFDVFQQFVKEKKINASKLRGSFNFDLLGHFLLFSKFRTTIDKDFEDLAMKLKSLHNDMHSFKCITVSGQNFHNAGADCIQELAFSLASGNEYLAQLTGKGVSIDAVSNSMKFVFAMGSNYFMEIAKLRAARLLWAMIVEQYKPKSKSHSVMNVHSVTSKWNKTMYDAHTNLLRCTTEAMSAIIGGCDILTVLPFDNTYKKSDNFSYRLSRNIQLILRSESYFDKVIDPSAGSYYVEKLTDSIAAAAWKLFQKVEEQGGFIEAVKNKFIHNEIKKTALKRNKEVAMQKQAIIGTNKYPNPDELMLDKNQANTQFTELGSLRQYRASQIFEAIRLSTEQFVKEGNNAPIVFIISIGDISKSKGRSTFAANFFGCAGYKIINKKKFASIKTGIDAALKNKADVVVLCASDEEYIDLAPQICKQIKTKKIDTLIVIAGNPTTHIKELKIAGVDYFIYSDSNILETLQSFNDYFSI